MASSIIEEPIDANQLFYKVGDTISGQWQGFGFVSDGKTSASLDFPTPKSLALVTGKTITCTKFKLAFRMPDGGYVCGSNWFDAYNNADYSVTPSFYPNVIHFNVTNTKGDPISNVNNIPVVGRGDFTITIS